ncbi:Ku protein [Embleya scabrispora]|uniref:Non-homologous end joining protein Ku n=1 Tax=Embleya scabrispora TaxID=159449 RepID=A0A1T3NKB9_9ACTN|nr:Ku protein [Embleya scabrispora]OPC77150.1 Ku protein [Embleya scabrispora]
MARAIWTGVINFGLVTVPVGLFSATQDHTIHFHQLQRGTGDRVRNRRVNERTGEEVDYADVVKGYDVGDGHYLTVEPEELADIAPGRSRSIDVGDFVDLAEIDPIHFDKTYYLAPTQPEYERVYALLLQALERTNRAGIALFVMRGRQYLTALRAQGRTLTLQTLHFADEIRDPAAELDHLPKKTAFKDRELAMAEQLVEAMAAPWRPEDYHDTYRERVEQLLDDKRRGHETVAADDAPEPTNVVDLMEALRRSVDTAASRGRGGSGKGGRSSTKRRASAKSTHPRGKKATQGGGKTRPRDTKAAKAGRSGATTKGDAEELSGLTKSALARKAADLDIPGRSKMTRDELEKAIRTAGDGGRTGSRTGKRKAS